ncbi:hypothetical protein FQZ97_1056830 [compost metagenome]
MPGPGSFGAGIDELDDVLPHHGRCQALDCETLGQSFEVWAGTVCQAQLRRDVILGTCQQRERGKPPISSLKEQQWRAGLPGGAEVLDSADDDVVVPRFVGGR